MRIGITGGIGSGKSYVARLLTEHFGIPVYDSHGEARRLMTESPLIRSGLQLLLGREAYTLEGQLCKPVIARYLFASPENSAKVNAIVHPAVKQDFLRWAALHEEPVALESAILLEAGFRDTVDCLMVVSAPESLRVQRAMRRDGVGEEAVRQRMARQLHEDERLQAADYIVHNDGRELLPQLSEFIKMFIHNEHITTQKNT